MSGQGPTRRIWWGPSGRKVFCIGFNKTGTTSLHSFFRHAGLRSRHRPTWPLYSHAWIGKPVLSLRADCYSDGQLADFAQLQDWFPRALFILNDRDEREWLRSRIRHVLRRGEVDLLTALGRRRPAAMLVDYAVDPRAAIDFWILERRLYQRKARVWFAGATNFLELRVTDDPDWRSTLADFLRRNGLDVPASAETADFHGNRSDARPVPASEALEAAYAIVDERLARTGAPVNP